MRVVEVPCSGPPEVLTMAERPDPRPAPGHLLITVRAAGVNFADIMGRMGLYPDAPPFPFVPGYEVAGTLPDGKRVIALTRFNGYAEKVVTPTEAVVPLPDALSFEEGAAIPVVYTTAWVALVAMARLAAGDRMLVEHAAGGVGLAAIQIARHAGAEVFGVVSSNAKAQFLQDLGVVPIVRSRDPWPQALDVILDPTGPSGLERDLRHLRPSGRLLLFGASEMVEGPTRRLLRVAWRYWRRPRLDLYVLMNRNRGVFGLNMLHLAEAPEIVSRALHEVMGGVADGWVKPRVDRTFPLAQAGQAHAYLQARKNIGKVVLIPG